MWKVRFFAFWKVFKLFSVLTAFEAPKVKVVPKVNVDTPENLTEGEKLTFIKKAINLILDIDEQPELKAEIGTQKQFEVFSQDFPTFTE